MSGAPRAGCLSRSVVARTRIKATTKKMSFDEEFAVLDKIAISGLFQNLSDYPAAQYYHSCVDGIQ